MTPRELEGKSLGRRTNSRLKANLDIRKYKYCQLITRNISERDNFQLTVFGVPDPLTVQTLSLLGTRICQGDPWFKFASDPGKTMIY